MTTFIRSAALALGLLAGVARAASPPPEEAENVNERYTVSRVEFPERYREDLSGDLRRQIDELAGKKYDGKAVREAARKAQRELKRKVTPRVSKGAEPETLVVAFDVSGRLYFPTLDTKRTELLSYHSRLGWNGGMEVDVIEGPTTLNLGFRNNGERKLERQAGLIGSFGRRIVSDRLAFRFDWENLRAQWNPTTVLALDTRPDLPGIYRRHDILAPSFAVRVAPPLTLLAGFELNRLQMQFPSARVEWANAVFGGVKAEHDWETGAIRHRIEADYRATSATGGLDSDFIYTQHRAGAMYRLRSGKEEFRVRFTAGVVNGNAPLFARFNLGNLDTLRGWSQFDVAPLGGGRMAHGSLEYRHDWFWTWYDTGAVYDRGSPSNVRHSVGLGIRPDRHFELGIGFPLHGGGITPVVFLRVGW
jgi:hypothetical protein